LGGPSGVWRRLLVFRTYVLLIYLLFDIVKIYLAKQLKTVLTPLVIYKLKQAGPHIIILGFGLFFIFQGEFSRAKGTIKNNYRGPNKVEAPSGFEPLYKLLQSSA
jgi:hypothetical protein